MHYEPIAEETIYIDLPDTDGLKIQAVLRGSLDQPLVILMHGRSGAGNSLLEYLGARYLHNEGFATCRLWMYGKAPQTRDIADCTLETHARDFETVVNHFRGKGIKKIFAAGHSYGGATILLSNAKLDGAVLWDASHGSFWAEHPDTHGKPPAVMLETLVVDPTGKGYVIPRAMFDNERSLGDTSSWAAGKGYPLAVISAGESALAPLGKRYFDAADEPKKYVVVEGAHHQFDDSDEILVQVYRETAAWFKTAL